MKKNVCMFLTIALLLAFVPAFSESTDDSSFVSFNSNLLNAMDNTASNWYSSSQMRAMFSVLALIDLSQTVSDLDVGTMLVNGTYVGKTEYGVAMSGYLENRVYMIVYTPVLKSANYFVTTISDTQSLSSTTADFYLKTFMSVSCNDDYIKNNLEDILSVAQTIQEALNS